MPKYYAFLVPGGLALFAAVAAIVLLIIERRQLRTDAKRRTIQPH